METENAEPKIIGYGIMPNWKVKGRQKLTLPLKWSDEPLNVRVVEGPILFYVKTVEQPTLADKKPRHLVVMPTGEPLPKGYSFVDTIVNGPWAWHVFIEDPPKKAKKKQTKTKAKANGAMGRQVRRETR